jgi:hypothetical protein
VLGSDGSPERGTQAARRNVETNPVRELFSKLVAGGLSAAVILLWWPRFFPADNATTWLVRGVVWTLSFELLLHALLPIERAVWESSAGRRVRHGATRAGDRIGAPRRSLRGSAFVACGALAVPVSLLVLAPAQPANSSTAAAVRHVTEVKRIVHVERRQVRVAEVMPVAGATPQRTAVSQAPVSTEQPRVGAPVSKKSPARTQNQVSGGGSTTPKGSNGSTSTQTPAGTGQGTATAPERAVDTPRVAPRAAAT